MSDADLGPSRYRMAALITKLQTQADDKLAEADAAIANLNNIATAAQDAIEASTTDRADLHAALDELTLRVAALETAAAPPVVTA